MIFGRTGAIGIKVKAEVQRNFCNDHLLLLRPMCNISTVSAIKEQMISSLSSSTTYLFFHQLPP